MKKLFFVILLLSATQAISQNVFSIQELIDIYLTDKEGAIKSIEAKGYAPGNSDQFREMFGRLSDDNQVFFQRRIYPSACQRKESIRNNSYGFN
ncbi:MAG TPA: hypothetical protein VFM90_07255 [Cyclobacteriaceae bacterium]|nr:hypothetical protein [Cyclobacteriaceae bacterium]